MKQDVELERGTVAHPAEQGQAGEGGQEPMAAEVPVTAGVGEEAPLDRVPGRRERSAALEEGMRSGSAIGVIGLIRVVERQRRASWPLTKVDETTCGAANERKATRAPVDPVVAREELDAVLAPTHRTRSDELP
jgi:hypothetical protein